MSPAAIKDYSDLRVTIPPDQRRPLIEHAFENAHDHLQSSSPPEPDAKKPAVGMWTLPEILAYQLDPADEIWPGGLLTQGDRTGIIGSPSVGKSRITLQGAIDTILGKEFLGFRTNAAGRKWLFLQTENSGRRLRYDLERMVAGYSKGDLATLAQCLHITSIERDPSGTMFFNADHPDRDRYTALIQEFDPAAVVIDPLRDTTTGDLNKDMDMAAVLSAISEIVRTGNPKRTPFISHHGRTGAMEASKVFGDDAGSFARNSKVLYGWLRSQINVAAAGMDQPRVVIFGCGKNSNGPKWEPFAARLDEKTMRYTRLDEADFDLDEWSEKMAAVGAGKRQTKAITPEQVAGVLKQAGGRLTGGIKSHDGLVQRVSRAYRVSRNAAQGAVEAACGQLIQSIQEPRVKSNGSRQTGGSPTITYVLKED